MTDWTFVGVEVVVGLAAVVAIVSTAVRRGLAGTPSVILRQLRKDGGRVERVVGARRSTWDPSKPWGLGNARWGQARATYQLKDDDLVVLRYQPRTGPAEVLEGPIPHLPDRPRTVLRRLLIGYGAALAAGFGVGVWVGHGPFGERLAWGAGGLAVVAMLLWVGATVILVVNAVRAIGTESRTPPPW